MFEGISQHDDVTVLTGGASFGLGEMKIRHPAGTFAVTPASLASLQAIGAHRRLLSGVGIDWGAACRILRADRGDFTPDVVSGFDLVCRLSKVESCGT